MTVYEATTPLLEVRDLGISAKMAGSWYQVVHDLSIQVGHGEFVALVGESGAGKSVTAMSIAGLLPASVFRKDQGEVILSGSRIDNLGTRELNRVRGREIGFVFQDAASALNPAFTVGDQIAEVMRVHFGVSRRQAWKQAVQLIDSVGIPSAQRRARSYPHELSGGMSQRVMIAAAIACNPSLLIADEPTTALDVTTQVRILDLLRELRAERSMSILLVSHDMGVVADACDRVAVMYAGELVEEAPIDSIFSAPQHPYTAALLAAMPYTALQQGQPLRTIPGQVPSPWELEPGCRFYDRCSRADASRCRPQPIELVSANDRLVRCVNPIVTEVNE